VATTIHQKQNNEKGDGGEWGVGDRVWGFGLRRCGENFNFPCSPSISTPTPAVLRPPATKITAALAAISRSRATEKL